MKRILRISLIVLACVLIPTVGLAAQPQEDIEITIDGKTIQPDVPPIIQDGRTLVPARFMFEPIGAKMEWNSESRVASGILGDKRVDMPIGSKQVKVNGKTKMLDAPAQIFKGRTYIPLRFAGEAFGRNVQWDGETRSITVGEDNPYYKAKTLVPMQERNIAMHEVFNPILKEIFGKEPKLVKTGDILILEYVVNRSSTTDDVTEIRDSLIEKDYEFVGADTGDGEYDLNFSAEILGQYYNGNIYVQMFTAEYYEEDLHQRIFVRIL